MNLRRASGTWVIVITFLLAFLLSAYPYPAGLGEYMPKWVALVLIFWVITLPHRIGLSVAWTVGLFLDLLEGNLLGQNALALSVVSYVLLILYQRMRMYNPWQQACLIFVLVGLYQLLCFWVLGIGGVAFDSMFFLIPALVTALCWPWAWTFLKRMAQLFDVN